MSFDGEKLFEFVKNQINEFANQHKEETFYAFAIDANLICLNSIEQAQKTLDEYQEKWERQRRVINSWDEMTVQDHKDIEWLLKFHQRSRGLDINDKIACLKIINQERVDARERENGNPYKQPDNISSLRHNTGDWSYQGFASMHEENGFDHQAYEQHYNMGDEEQLNSEYGLAMDQLVKKLIESDSFKNLNRTNDFYAIRVEHNY